MRLISVLFIVFLMAAFAIGVSVEDSEMADVNVALTNASIIATNFTLNNVSDNAYIECGFRVVEKFVHLAVIAMVEVMRMGVLFGHDNPSYFEPEFIMKIATAIVWLTILSLMFVPLMYFTAFLIMIVIWVKDLIKKRREVE